MKSLKVEEASLLKMIGRDIGDRDPSLTRMLE
jgi:hypothetical protein